MGHGGRGRDIVDAHAVACSGCTRGCRLAAPEQLVGVHLAHHLPPVDTAAGLGSLHVRILAHAVALLVAPRVLARLRFRSGALAPWVGAPHGSAGPGHARRGPHGRVNGAVAPPRVLNGRVCMKPVQQRDSYGGGAHALVASEELANCGSGSCVWALSGMAHGCWFVGRQPWLSV